MRQWRRANPDRDLANAQAWRKQNRDKERERYRRYDEANRENRRQAIAQSRATHPKHHRELRHKWREANLETERARCRAYWHRRRSKEDPPATVDAYAELLLDQACTYCGAKDDITIDHVVPLSRGGHHDIENLAAACRSCNSSKGTKLLDEWLPLRAA